MALFQAKKARSFSQESLERAEIHEIKTPSNWLTVTPKTSCFRWKSLAMTQMNHLLIEFRFHFRASPTSSSRRIRCRDEWIMKRKVFHSPTVICFQPLWWRWDSRGIIHQQSSGTCSWQGPSRVESAKAYSFRTGRVQPAMICHNHSLSAAAVVVSNRNLAWDSKFVEIIINENMKPPLARSHRRQQQYWHGFLIKYGFSKSRIDDSSSNP